MVGEKLPELGQGRGLIEDREVAVSVAGEIASAEFNGGNAQSCELTKHVAKRKLREEGGEDADFHRFQSRAEPRLLSILAALRSSRQ